MVKITGKGLRLLRSLHLLGVIAWMGGSVCSFVLLLYSHWYVNCAVPDKMSLLFTFDLLEFIDFYIIITGALATVFIGVIYAVFTNWGFIKTRWVAVKWVLSLAIIISGTIFYLPRIEQMRQMVFGQGLEAIDSPAYLGLNGELCLLLSVHLGLYLLMVFLSSWKPRLGQKTALPKQKS